MFDFSLPEFIFMGGLCYFFIGGRQLPTAAYYLGRGLGRTVGLFGRARQLVGDLAQSETFKKHRNEELSKGFKQFTDIQRELQGVTMNPVHAIRSAMFENVTNSANQFTNPTDNDQSTQRDEQTQATRGNMLNENRMQGSYAPYRQQFTPKSSYSNTPMTSSGSDLIMSIYRERHLLLKLEEEHKKQQR